jgi:hypothetical protein
MENSLHPQLRNQRAGEAWRIMVRHTKARGNSGDSQVCELDHLVPLELGRADGLANIWPMRRINVLRPLFQIKDRVELPGQRGEGWAHAALICATGIAD